MTTKKQNQPPKQRTVITQQHIDSISLGPENILPECKPYEPMPGVIPDTEAGKNALAMDSTPYDLINRAVNLDIDAAFFIGYPALATLSQRVEYYNMAQVMGEEVVRNWIQIKSTDEDAEAVEEMEDLLVKYDIKRLFQKATVQDCFFGVSHIYVDTSASDEEIQNPLILDRRAIPKGTKIGFRTVDPTWVYPAMYNTSKPLRADFYKPQQWFVMGQIVHESRFIDIVTRPVPDILKPSYNFGGMSLSQFMMPYVNDWLDMKRNVVGIVKTLRMRALKTDMDARLQNPGEFDKRINMFVKYQENFGLWAIDLAEEIEHHQTSLSDLSNLLSNFQEQLCMPARTTNLKYLGSAPAGLNASGESEIETWHETVSGYQEHLRHALENIFKIIQLAEFGEVRDDIYFEFKPLDELTEKEQAEINEIKVRTVVTATDAQIYSTEQGAEVISNIPGAGFEDLEPMQEEDDEFYDGPSKGPVDGKETA